MDMTKVENIIPGLTRSCSKLRHNQEFKDPVVTVVIDCVEIENNCKPLTTMVYMFITCSLTKKLLVVKMWLP